MLTVVSILWGDWCKPYGIEYVNKLYSMVKRHLSIPHDFICFTDRPNEIDFFTDNIDVRPLDMPDWPLNFKKLFLYKPGNGLKGRIFYIDLDSVIIGSLDEMASYSGEFCGIAPFNPLLRHKHTAGGLLSFEAGYGEHIWDEVSNNLEYWVEKTKGGNERYVYKHLVENPDRWQDLYPGQLVSYRLSCRWKKEPPPDARFIAFYAVLRPHLATEKWIKEAWSIDS